MLIAAAVASASRPSIQRAAMASGRDSGYTANVNLQFLDLSPAPAGLSRGVAKISHLILLRDEPSAMPQLGRAHRPEDFQHHHHSAPLAPERSAGFSFS